VAHPHTVGMRSSSRLPMYSNFELTIVLPFFHMHSCTLIASGVCLSYRCKHLFENHKPFFDVFLR
jgi:hypothetical protein